VNYKIIPNVLTILRIILVLPCAHALYTENYNLAIAIFVLASITDCIDGFLARRLSCQSKLGAILDPLADKLLIVALFLVLTLKNLLPLWFSIIIISREVVLLSGAAFYRFMFGPVIFIPTMLSKINTCLLLFLLLCVLLKIMGFSLFIENNFIYYVTMATLVTSIYSGLDYAWQWGVRVYKSIKASK